MAITEDAGNILKVFGKGLNKINAPGVLFTQDEEINPIDLVGGEATHTNPPLSNGGITPLLTQSTSQYPPLVDTPDAPDSTPLGAQEDASDAACLAIMSDLSRERLMYANDKILGF